jgi:hypothetical protein
VIIAGDSVVAPDDLTFKERYLLIISQWYIDLKYLIDSTLRKIEILLQIQANRLRIFTPFNIEYDVFLLVGSLGSTNSRILSS